MKILPPWLPALACTRWRELCCLSDLPGAWRQPWTSTNISKHTKNGSESTEVLSTGSLLWQHPVVLKGFISSLTWLASLPRKYCICSCWKLWQPYSGKVRTKRNCRGYLVLLIYGWRLRPDCPVLISLTTWSIDRLPLSQWVPYVCAIYWG